MNAIFVLYLIGVKLNKIFEIIVIFFARAINVLVSAGVLWLVWNILDHGGPLFGLRNITFLQSIIIIALVDIVAARFGVNDNDNNDNDNK